MLKAICRLCGETGEADVFDGVQTGTGLCNGCYELESRIQRNPELAEKVLAAYRAPEAEPVGEYTVGIDYGIDGGLSSAVLMRLNEAGKPFRLVHCVTDPRHQVDVAVADWQRLYNVVSVTDGEERGTK